MGTACQWDASRDAVCQRSMAGKRGLAGWQCMADGWRAAAWRDMPGNGCVHVAHWDPGLPSPPRALRCSMDDDIECKAGLTGRCLEFGIDPGWGLLWKGLAWTR
mmetsp:Transcript_71249/g.141439  ORF Transcript_71249/g.141439 Transcript_71249/m.141439 type:complete len:104 (+) Transcript_71249:177-488(+)